MNVFNFAGMGMVILLIVALMILFAVVALVINIVQKAKRRNDGLAKKSKLLEMYAAEERAKEQAEAAQREKEKNDQK